MSYTFSVHDPEFLLFPLFADRITPCIANWNQNGKACVTGINLPPDMVLEDNVLGYKGGFSINVGSGVDAQIPDLPKINITQYNNSNLDVDLKAANLIKKEKFRLTTNDPNSVVSWIAENLNSLTLKHFLIAFGAGIIYMAPHVHSAETYVDLDTLFSMPRFHDKLERLSANFVAILAARQTYKSENPHQPTIRDRVDEHNNRVRIERHKITPIEQFFTKLEKELSLLLEAEDRLANEGKISHKKKSGSSAKCETKTKKPSCLPAKLTTVAKQIRTLQVQNSELTRLRDKLSCKLESVTSERDILLEQNKIMSEQLGEISELFSEED